MEDNTLTFDQILAEINPEAVKKEEQGPTLDTLEVEEEQKKEDTLVNKDTKSPEIKKESADLNVKTKDDSFLKVAKKYLEKGKWQDVLIEDEEGNKVSLSEMSDLDEDTFLQIQENQEKEAKEATKNDFISVKELDERKKQVLDIFIKGGDLKQIFGKQDALEQYLDPYKGIDLDDDKVQENIYFNYLKQKGYSDSAARFELSEKKKELTLDTEVVKIVETANKNAQEYVTQKQKEIEDKRIAALEEEKEYKKNLSKVMKDRDLKDTTIKKYVDLATKKTEEGDFAIDSMYNEIMQDPEKAIDLIAFISDKDTFLKEYKASAKTEATKETLRSIKILKPKEKSVQKEIKEEGLKIEMAE